MEKNITVVTCSMNRNHQLKKNILAAQNIKNLYRHIIIDYSSELPVSSFLDVVPKNVFIYRINNQKIWWLTRAYNAAFELVDTDFTFKLDADVEIDFDFFNDMDYEEYDHILFTNNNNDSGNFLVKTNLLKDVNGFNEYILRGYNDHDLLNRIKYKNVNINTHTVFNKIKKDDHPDELRVRGISSKYLKKNKNFYYGLVKGYNDYHGLISKNNLWSNQKKIYKIKDYDITIEHLYTSRDLSLKIKLKCKIIFLKTFFRIYYRNENTFKAKLVKRILPYILYFLSQKFIKKYFGIIIFPSEEIVI